MTNHILSTAQQKIGSVAQDMLEDRCNYLQGAIELEKLRHEIGAYENDPDFMPFVAILTELDHSGISRDKNKWTDVILKSQEFENATQWAKEVSLQHCQALARRYTQDNALNS